MTDHTAEAQALLDLAATERMEFVPRVDCEAPGHAASRSGCEAKDPATYYLRMKHTDGKSLPRIVPVCVGKVIHVRGSLNETAHCPICHLTTPLSTFVEIVGPIVPENR